MRHRFARHSTAVACAPPACLHDEAVSAVILGEGSLANFLKSAKYGSVDELRFLAHLSIVPGVPHDVSQALLKAYISHLVDAKLPNLVALYVSMLDEQERVDTYVKVCLVTGRDDVRSTVYSLGISHLPDQMEEVLATAVRSTINSDDEPYASKLSSLEWLTFDECYALELLSMSNLLLRQLMSRGLFETCQSLLVSHLPHTTVQTIRTMVSAGGEAEGLESDADSAVWEHESLAAGVVALTKYSLWKETHARVVADDVAEGIGPREGGVGDTADLEALSEEEREIARKMKEREERLRTSEKVRELVGVAAEAIEALQSVLLFEGGYLNFSGTGEEEEPGRSDELSSLRSDLIPLFLNMLVHVNLTMGTYTSEKSYLKATIELAVVVARPETRIMEVLGRESVEGFLGKVAESGVKYVGLGGVL